jgi:hypothetical protein
VAGRKEEREADIREGMARVGGRGRIFYDDAYVRSARLILDETASRNALEDLAMPCVYLQRHALELMLKDLIDAICYLEACDDALSNSAVVNVEKLREKGMLRLSKKDQELLRSHRLLDLATKANELLAKYDEALPESIFALARDLHAFESGDETRVRYPRGKPSGAYAHASFPAEVRIPLRDWQGRLELVLRDVISVRPDEERADPDTLNELLTDAISHHELALSRKGLWQG